MNASKYEQMRIPQLQTLHRGITHKKEILQLKMAADMGRSSCLDILPRNYDILPMGRCSLHDSKLLEELHEQAFDVYWTIEKKKAEETGNLEKYYAEFKWYSFIDCLNDDEKNEVWNRIERYCRQRMTSHQIIQCIMEAPNFLEEVLV
jgi:hypothetical protein